MVENDRDFYSALPIFESFAEVVRAESFAPVPDDWVVGFSDVTGSTAAIAAGRYKAVNMIGAGAIAAVVNAIGRKPFPFVFGGDGASLAVSSADAGAAAVALAAMASALVATLAGDVERGALLLGYSQATFSRLAHGRGQASQRCYARCLELLEHHFGDDVQHRLAQGAGMSEDRAIEEALAA